MQATGLATRTLLRRTGELDVPLDATLLETYFGAFRAAGDLPAPATAVINPGRSGEPLLLDGAFFSRLLNSPIAGVEILGTGSDESIVSELTAWRSRRTTGLFRVRLTGHDGSSRDVIAKVKARDTDVIAVGEGLAGLVDEAVGREYVRFSDRIGFTSSHVREIEIYRQQDPRFRRHSPALLGSMTDESADTWVAVVEHVNDAVAVDGPRYSAWRPAHVENGVNGLAALHGIWIGREKELSAQPWIGYVQSTASMVEMSSLWGALASHAAPLYSLSPGPDLATIHRRLLSRLEKWWPALEAGPRTLIHNDFNPRNVCLRGPEATLCAYDWELATLGAPQRDLAEFLCFVLPPDATLEDVMPWIERHRTALEREHGRSIDRELWLEGFRSALYDLLINRLSIYAVVHRVRRQPFLPNVLRTWRRMYQLFPLENAS